MRVWRRWLWRCCTLRRRCKLVRTEHVVLLRSLSSAPLAFLATCKWYLMLQRDATVGIGVRAQTTAGNSKRHTSRRRAGPRRGQTTQKRSTRTRPKAAGIGMKHLMLHVTSRYWASSMCFVRLVVCICLCCSKELLLCWSLAGCNANKGKRATHRKGRES